MGLIVFTVEGSAEHPAKLGLWSSPELASARQAATYHQKTMRKLQLKTARPLESREVHERRGRSESFGNTASSDCRGASPVVPTDPPQEIVRFGALVLLAFAALRPRLVAMSTPRLLAIGDGLEKNGLGEFGGNRANCSFVQNNHLH